MKAVPLLSRMEELGRRREHNSPSLQEDIAASPSLFNPSQDFSFNEKNIQSQVLWSECYLCAALCLRPPLMKFGISLFQLEFQMFLSFGGMRT